MKGDEKIHARYLELRSELWIEYNRKLIELENSYLALTGQKKEPRLARVFKMGQKKIPRR